MLRDQHRFRLLRLLLRPGARVILLSNVDKDGELQLVNGSTGTVTGWPVSTKNFRNFLFPTGCCC